MAITNLLSKYRSISRPKLGGTSTGTYSTYAKQQQAAEDKIIDNQYEDGILSPEAYLSSLQARLSRGGITPVAQVNLQEKIRTVQEKVNDVTVSQRYQAGQMTTDEVIAYEKQKLSRMTEPGSAAYITQSQKIQQLTDKSEKEKRAAYRISEMNRIAQLPDDSSAVSYEKARLYQELSDQARLDGDNSQADQLATQAINYTNAAKKGDINDLITNARLSVSETAGAGLGTPSSDGGLSRLTGSGSVQGGATGAGGTGSASASVTTGFTGIKNTAVNNALESLDRQYKSYERTSQEINDTNKMISAYQNAISQADGDQKTQLTIALNNLIESKRNKENQLGILESNIQDTVVRIQEIQTKAAGSAFNQEVRKTNQQFDKAETDLETAFAKGEITKDEYIAKGEALAATKVQFYSQASDVFNQYGNDSSAESYLEKASKMEEIHQGLINVATNIDDYEPIMADPTGKVTNLLGKSIKPGEITLTNVRQLKDSGDFETNYTNDNGVFKRIYYPGVKGDLDGGYVSKSLAEDLAKEATEPDKSPFVYGANKAPGGIGPTTGKVERQPLVKTTTGQWVTPNAYDTMKQTANQSLDQVIGKTSKTQQLIDQVKQPTQIKTPSFLDRVLNPASALAPAKKDGFVTSAINNAKDSLGNWFSNAASGVKDIFNTAKDRVASATSGIKFPQIVKKAYANDTSSGDSELETIIKSVFPREQWDNALRVAMGESSMNPEAMNTGNKNKSVDYGLFQINSIHLPWIKQKYGWSEKDLGDPVKNTIIAKEIYDRSKGWSPWVAANKQGIRGYTPAPTPKPEEIYSRVPPKQVTPEVKGASISPSLNPQGKVVPDSGYFVEKKGNISTRVAAPQNVPAPSSAGVRPFIPPENRVNIQPPPMIKPSNPIEAVRNLVTNVGTMAKPVVQKIQQVATPVVQKATNFVSNAVNNVKNALSNFFKRK